MPRTIPQAEALEQHGIDVDTALSIEIADETIIERMSGRRTCKDCSATFHIVSNPPQVEGKCDFCGGELTIRKDDAPETVKARLDVYHAETEPLKDFYAQRGKLVKVDNQPTIEATTAAIEKALGLECLSSNPILKWISCGRPAGSPLARAPSRVRWWSRV